MGLFDSKDKGNSKPIAPDVAAPGAGKDDTQQPDRMKEIRGLSGFNSLDDVAATAQDIINESARKSADRKRVTPKQKEEMEAQLKAQKRALALQTLGKFFCKELTTIPYDLWAKFYNDPALKLSVVEAERLTEATFLVVQGFDIDFSSPWIGLTGLLLMHGAIIGQRMQHLVETGAMGEDKEEKKETQPEKLQ